MDSHQRRLRNPDRCISLHWNTHLLNVLLFSRYSVICTEPNNWLCIENSKNIQTKLLPKSGHAVIPYNLTVSAKLNELNDFKRLLKYLHLVHPIVDGGL